MKYCPSTILFLMYVYYIFTGRKSPQKDYSYTMVLLYCHILLRYLLNYLVLEGEPKPFQVGTLPPFLPPFHNFSLYWFFLICNWPQGGGGGNNFSLFYYVQHGVKSKNWWQNSGSPSLHSSTKQPVEEVDSSSSFLLPLSIVFSVSSIKHCFSLGH